MTSGSAFTAWARAVEPQRDIWKMKPRGSCQTPCSRAARTRAARGVIRARGALAEGADRLGEERFGERYVLHRHPHHARAIAGDQHRRVDGQVRVAVIAGRAHSIHPFCEPTLEE